MKIENVRYNKAEGVMTDKREEKRREERGLV